MTQRPAIAYRLLRGSGARTMARMSLGLDLSSDYSMTTWYSRRVALLLLLSMRASVPTFSGAGVMMVLQCCHYLFGA